MVQNMESSIKKVIEPVMSYEELLLNQINYCAKILDDHFLACVERLMDIIPKEVEEEVLRRFRKILKPVINFLNDDRCRSLNSSSNEGKLLRSYVDEIYNSYDEDFRLYERFVYYLVLVYCNQSSYIPNVKALLKFRIIIDVLEESGLLGLKNKGLYVGRVNVSQ
jgi:hypothetical protein